MRYVFSDAVPEKKKLYEQYLKAISSISYLFTESTTPYLDYRIAENLFCRCFAADNLSRSCIAVDARIGNVGIGIKTFIDVPYQKIAEFDKKRSYTDTGDTTEDAYRVSELRNERLDFSRNAYAIEDFIYHYIIRRERSLSICESPMDYVNTDSIKITRENEKGFDFTDGNNLYRFNRAKSTMFEYFDLTHPISTFNVEFIEDPVEAVMKLYSGEMLIDNNDYEETLVLPLFSTRGHIHVPEKSGLNQWNASGRARDYDEIYIPFNKEFRESNPEFFPSRDTPFDLELPDGRIISAKVCQDSGKAIMSNPNKDLGKWLLRDVLHLKDGELVTMDMLDNLGVNAVMFTKHAEGSYSIDFTNIDY